MDNVKTGIFGDCHIGVRNGSHAFRSFQKKYILKYMIPYYKGQGIKDLWGLGDLFDIRRSLLGLDMYWLVNELLPALEDAGITLHLIVGNHEIALRDSCEINYPKWLEREAVARGSHCVIAYDKPQEVEIGDTKFLAIPWVCNDNHDRVVEMITNTDATVCLGHLELEGFLLCKGSLSKHSTLDKGLLSKFDLVLSGHYHSSSRQGNIHYLGTPYSLTWGEWEEPAENGVYVFDTLTQKLEFIPNSEDQSMFCVIEYNYSEITSKKQGKKWLDKGFLENELNLKDKVIKIEVTDRDNSSHYKKFLTTMRLVDCVNFTTLDLTKEVETFEQDVTAERFKVNTLDVLLEKVDDTEGINHEGVAEKLKMIHTKCVEQSNLIK